MLLFSVFQGQNLKPACETKMSPLRLPIFCVQYTPLRCNQTTVLKCLSRTTAKLYVNKELMIYEYANKPIQGFAVATITYPRGVNQIKSLEKKKKMSASSVI